MEKRNQTSKVRSLRGFSIVELLTVVSVIALLAAILQPVLIAARRRAYESSCVSNLRQIGVALRLYGGDWDDKYPCAIDEFTRINPESKSDFQEPLKALPDIVSTLSDKIGSNSNIWKCPLDTSPFEVAESTGTTAKTYVSAFAFAGTSYAFSCAQIFGKSESQLIQNGPPICKDAGYWHSIGSSFNYSAARWNALYSDGHVKLIGFTR